MKIGDRVTIDCVHDAGFVCEAHGKIGIVSDVRYADFVCVKLIDNQRAIYAPKKWLKEVNPQLTFVFKE